MAKGSTRDAGADAPSVLIVDDDAEFLQLIARRLELDGFRVDVSRSAEAALIRYLSRRSSEHPYTALVIDVRLGALDGTDLLRLVRMLDDRSTILMMSGCVELADAVESLRAGADDYLGKPLKTWDIKDRVTTAIGRRRSIGSRSSAPEERGVAWGECFQSSSPVVETSETTTREGPSGGEQNVTAREKTVADVSSRRRTREGSFDTESVDLPSVPDTVGSIRRSRLGSSSDTPTRKMGRETGAGVTSGAIGSHRRRFGESCAGGPRREDSADAPGREGRSRGRADELPGTSREGTRGSGGSTERLGGKDDAWASSPLDALFELARGVEAGADCAGHSDRAARCLTKVAAYLAGALGLGPMHLEALRVAAGIFGIGRLRDRDEVDPFVCARLLQEIENQSEVRVPADPEVIGTARRILEGVASRRAQIRSARASQPIADEAAGAGPRCNVLISLFEVAERWARHEDDAARVEPRVRAELDPLPAGLDAATVEQAIQALARLAW